MKRDQVREWWRRRRADVTALGTVGVFFVAFFPHVLFSDRFIITSDAFFYNYPLRTVAWDMLRHGTLPLWTPHILSGYPLLSMAQVALGYPLTWGYLFLRGPWAEQAYVLAPFFLSPIFTYAYARTLGRSRLGALLAGLSFGYGGMMCGALANSGVMTNTMMWTPLVLLFIERSRTRALVRCLSGATLTYAMSVLAGHAQSFVYVGLLALTYGLFLSLVPTKTEAEGRKGKWTNWRPLAVAAGALLFATGLAAWQILETARAARRSVRAILTFEIFSEGSFTLSEALLSLGAQLYHVVDSSPYLAALTLALAIVATLGARRGRDPRVWYWLAVALSAWLFLLGPNTPLYRVVYHLPILNLFRVPSRHTFEWTFAVSILAAYGWDTTMAYFQRGKLRTRKSALIAALGLLALTAVVGALWWRVTARGPNLPETFTALPEHLYWVWKFAFTVLVLVLVWWAAKLPASRWRAGILTAAIAFACFFEARLTVGRWWAGAMSMSGARVLAVSPTTRYLQQFPATENRVYSHVVLMSEHAEPEPRFEAPNRTAPHGLQNVAGYEPLILERYSRALGGVGPDAVSPRPGFQPNDDLFRPSSHVLDLLNTTHAVFYAHLAPRSESLANQGSRLEPLGDLPPGTMKAVNFQTTDADALMFVTSLSNSVSEPDGQTVARVRIHTISGKIFEREFRAGRDTAEWAHERPDVRRFIRHKLATVYDSTQVDGPAGFPAYRYKAVIQLGEHVKINRVEISNVSQTARLGIYGIVLQNSSTQTSVPLSEPGDAWPLVYEQNGVVILRNPRALPRAWLVTEAEAVNEEEALSRIRGESDKEFDPRRTALLEVHPHELPALTGGLVSPDSSARIVSYEPNRLVIETSAPTATVLVLSEIFYPGWEATVDGNRVNINVANYLLRAVHLSAGSHRVEMRYIAPAARSGALISIATLSLLGGLAILSWRGRAG